MRKSLPYIAGLSLILIVLNACAPQKPALQHIKDAGVLHVLTRNAATTYFTGPNGPQGLEYDLVKAFADQNTPFFKELPINYPTIDLSPQYSSS
jgi:membrane-bound lytic murein transglycosylase MltF